MTDCLLQDSQPQNSPLYKYKEDSFESESTTSSSDESTNQNTLDSLNNINNNELSQNPTQTTMKTQNSTSSPIKKAQNAVYKHHKIWKPLIVAFGILFLFSGRSNIPNNDVETLKDNVLDYLIPINNWIHAQANLNSIWPKLLLFFCATNMDLIFFATVVHWLKHGKTSRLLISLSIFYITRIFVQMMSFQPFPKGYYWDSPGFPSFVAPYGRSTDFFFSGHSGFLVLMQNEWGRNGCKKMQRYIQFNLVYTIFVLLVCQAHYSIDIFTGVFFADYVFGKVDAKKDVIDQFFKDCAEYIEKAFIKTFGKKTEKKEE